MTLPGPAPAEEQGLLGQVGSFLGGAAEAYATAPLADVVPVIGDARAVYRGLFESEGMSPLERTLSILPLAAVVVGAGALGRSYLKARGATRSVAEMLAASQQRNLSVAPMDTPYLTRMPAVDTALPPSQVSAYSYASRYSATGEGPYARALGAETYEQLAGHLTGRTPETVPLHLVGDLPYVGAELVRNTRRPYAGATVDEQKMNAARSAMARMEIVDEMEVMDPAFKPLWEAWKSDNISEVDRRIVTRALIDIETGLRDVAGPDMVFSPYVALAGWMTDADAPTPVISLSGAAIDNPRVLDPATGAIPDPAGLERAINRLDPMSVVGEMAGNEINAIANLASPEQVARGETWWKRYHDLSRELTALSGVPIHQVSSAIASLSPATRWTPDNILGGVHLVLQHARPELKVASAEYQDLLEQLLRKSGWWDELIESKGFRPHQLKVDFSQQLRGRRGGKGGLQLTNTNIQKAVDLIKGMPWQQRMIALKTKKMAMLGANPLLSKDVVIDRHDFTLLMGFRSDIDLPQFDSPRHYQAMEQAHILAADVLEHREASTGQAIGWMVMKEDSEALGLGTARLDKDREVYSEGISGLIEQADDLAPNPVSMTENVSNEVGAMPPPPPQYRGKSGAPRGPAGHKGEGNVYDHDHVLLLVPQPDGRVKAFAPPDTPGLEDKLRHLYVSPVSDGRVHQLMPRQPAPVLDMEDVRRPFAQGPEEVRSYMPVGENTHPALEKGTVIYVEVDSPDTVPLIEEAIGPYGVYEIAQNPVGVTQGAVPTRNLSLEDLDTIADLEGPNSPMLHNDWVILTSQKGELGPDGLSAADWDNLVDLKARVRKMGYEYHSTDGSYSGAPEMSITVFGMSYKDAVALGKRYDQESVATAAGLIYTSGVNKGKMNPATTGHLFGNDAVDTENYSIITVGGRDMTVAWQYDFDELVDIDNIETIVPSTQQAAGGRVGLSVKMGHAASWRDVRDITKAVRPHAQSTSVYATGRNLPPDGWREAFETVYQGTNGEIVSVRTKASPGMNNPNVYKVYVSPEEWLRIGDGTVADAPTVRDIDGSRAVVNGQTMVSYLGPNGPGVDIRIKGPNQLKGSIDGKRIKAALVTPGAVHVLGDRPSYPAPEGVTAWIVNGKVTSVEGDPSAIDDAVRTLRRLGAEVPDEAITFRNAEAAGVADIVANWWALSGRVPQPTFKDPVTGVTRARPHPGSQAASATISEMLGVPVLINLPPAFTDKHTRDLFGAFKALVDDGWPADLYDLEHLPGGVEGFLPPKPLIMGATPSRGPMKIVLSEHYAYAANGDPELWRKISPPGEAIRQNAGISGERSIFATVAVHESGHLIISRMNELGFSRAFRNRMGQALDEMGGIPGVTKHVGGYATNGWEELFSEMLVVHTYERSSAHPAILSLMEDAQKVLRGDEAARQWALRYMGTPTTNPSLAPTPDEFWRMI